MPVNAGTFGLYMGRNSIDFDGAMALLKAKPVAAGYADTAGSLGGAAVLEPEPLPVPEPVPVPVPTAAAMEATPQPIFTNPALSDSDAEGGAVGGIKRARKPSGKAKTDKKKLAGTGTGTGTD